MIAIDVFSIDPLLSPDFVIPTCASVKRKMLFVEECIEKAEKAVIVLALKRHSMIGLRSADVVVILQPYLKPVWKIRGVRITPTL